MWIVSLPRNFPDFPLTSHWYIMYYYYPIHKSGITITYYITETTPWHHYTPSGWWYTYPSEKYGSQIGSSSQLLGKIKVMFQTTNQQAISFIFRLCLLPGPSSQTCKTAAVLMRRVKATARVPGYRAGGLQHHVLCQKTWTKWRCLYHRKINLHMH